MSKDDVGQHHGFRAGATGVYDTPVITGCSRQQFRCLSRLLVDFRRDVRNEVIINVSCLTLTP
jgi:hypothetical protein